MSKNERGSGRSRRGQNTIEVIAGLFVLVPLALFRYDLYVIVLSNQLVDRIAKDCARAAANQADQASADAAAETAKASFHQTANVTSMSIQHPVAYVANDTVSVTLDMTVQLPVPFPGLDNTPHFHAKAVEPVVTVSH